MQLTTRPRRLRDWRILLIAVVVIVGAAVAVHTAQNKNGNSKTVWTENFNGAAGTSPSSKNWIMSTGTSYPGGAAQWGTGEIESYTADTANASLDGDGHLKITATRDESGNWHSARLESRRTDLQAEAGGTLTVQARIQVPDGGAGYWPAFWMLGQDFRGNYVNWPGIGEVDIMEVNGGVPNVVHGTLHCGVTPGGPCDENNGISGKSTVSGAPLSAGFHTYAVELDRSKPVEEIRWYVDGHQYFTVRSTDVDAATWAKATQHGFFVLLNLAIGGAFVSPPDATTKASASMTVDYVTVTRG